MPEYSLKEYIQPFPSIDVASFIFVPPPTGPSRTWIFRATEDPQMILSFHFSSLLVSGWKVTEGEGSLLAERGGSGILVNAARRKDETRITYEIQTHES